MNPPKPATQPDSVPTAFHCADRVTSTVAKPVNFDHIARPYRWLEYLSLGHTLERSRLHFLSALLEQKRALALGDGDGRFTAILLATNSTIHVTAVDISAAMLALLRNRCAPNSTRLETNQASALTVPLHGPYDLLITHFFLDCLPQPDLETLIARTTPMLAPKALWAISDFRIPSGPLRLPARIYIRSLYLAFRILTGLRTTHLPDHATPLAQAGFTRIGHHGSLAGLLTSELWQAPSQRPS